MQTLTPSPLLGGSSLGGPFGAPCHFWLLGEIHPLRQAARISIPGQFDSSALSSQHEEHMLLSPRPEAAPVEQGHSLP